MERAHLLSNLAANGTDITEQRLTQLATEIDLPAADLLVTGGTNSVP
ncbi:hypothetical protein ACH4U5_01775 [Streptomyces sp. NPDC020858]